MIADLLREARAELERAERRLVEATRSIAERVAEGIEPENGRKRLAALDYTAAETRELLPHKLAVHRAQGRVEGLLAARDAALPPAPPDPRCPMCDGSGHLFFLQGAGRCDECNGSGRRPDAAGSVP